MDATKWLATQAGWSALFNTPWLAKKQSVGEQMTPTKKGVQTQQGGQPHRVGWLGLVS